MNISYTHKFTDHDAAVAGARLNLKHMMVLFWWDNIPQEVRAMRQPWLDAAEEAIEEFIDDLADEDFTALVISNFLSRLVTDTKEMYRDNTN